MFFYYRMSTTGNANLVDDGSSTVNISQILEYLKRLTPEERDLLHKELGLTKNEDIIDWLNTDKMNIKPYEQTLMQYDEYRLHKILYYTYHLSSLFSDVR